MKLESPSDGRASGEDSWVPPPPDTPLGDARRIGLSSPMGAIDRDRLASEWRGEPADSAPEIAGVAILGECGRGGTGVVYTAEEVGLGRRVAVKVLRPELAASEAQRARFRAEARALAQLQHPNIVQVFWAGESLGRAYIVQEFVAGGLDRELARQPRSARPAAELVATLARAVEYAHGRGILHRDLKPSNVLLTDDGRPKIGDFGLAKQIGPEGGSGPTQTGSILGSPSYMAPEQASGRNAEVGAAADVYALGAILYEALTGVPPFLAASPLETLVLVRAAEPLAPRRMRPGLPIALETICLKCLQKDPARRYASAGALADDLERFLAGQPVLARPTPPRERVARWVRRQPALAACSAVTALAIAALMAGGIVYEGRLRAARDRALGQERRAEARYRAAGEALDRMLERLKDPRFARTPQLRDLLRLQLEDVLAFYDRVAREGGGDPEPTVRFDLARFRLQAAQIQGQLGRPQEAAANAREAMPLLRNLVRDEPGRPEYVYTLARGYRSIAPHEPDPDATLRRAVGLLIDLVDRYPGRSEFRLELAEARNNLAGRAHDAHDMDRSAAEYRRAIEALGPLVGPRASASDSGPRIILAENHRNLAVILQQGPLAREVPRHYEVSRQLLQEVLAADPDRDEAALALGGTLFNWAINLASDPAGRRDALPLFDEAIARIGPLARREPGWQKARIELLAAHGGRAQALEAEGRHGDAVRDWERVVDLAEPEEQKGHHRFFLAMARARAGDHRGAVALVRALETGLGRRPPVYSLHLAAVCSSAMQAALRDSALSEAERERLGSEYARRAVAILEGAIEHLPAADAEDLRRSLSGNSDLAPIRARPEFRALAAGAGR